MAICDNKFVKKFLQWNAWSSQKNIMDVTDKKDQIGDKNGLIFKRKINPSISGQNRSFHCSRNVQVWCSNLNEFNIISS